MRLMDAMAVWAEPILVVFLVLWAGGSIWVLASGRRLSRYVLPWPWASTHEGIRMLLVRLTATLNFIAAVRMLLKAAR